MIHSESPVSIRQLASEGRNLRPVAAAEIHYPESGAGWLQQIEEDHFWFTSRRNLILRLLRRHGLKSSGEGLDIGCGSGFTTGWMNHQGYKTYGIDAYLPPLMRGGASRSFVTGDIFSITPAEEFDFVLLLDVIEHMEDDLKFVDQASRFLKPGGLMIISVPSFKWLWSSVDDAAGHQRRYTKRTLSELASKTRSGMHLEFQSYYYGTLLPLYLLSRLRKNDAKTLKSETSPPGVINSLFKEILKFEMGLLGAGGLPVGSSLFSVLRKSGPA